MIPKSGVPIFGKDHAPIRLAHNAQCLGGVPLRAMRAIVTWTSGEGPQEETLVQKSFVHCFFRSGQGTLAPKTVLHVPDTMRHSHVNEQPPLRSVKLGPMALAGDAVAISTPVSAAATSMAPVNRWIIEASGKLDLVIIVTSPLARVEP
jgi:hypothetical protein